MNRNQPELYKMEGADNIPLKDFYTDECNVFFIEKDGHTLALDFDDPSIMYQDETDTYRMNLLYAHEHMKVAHDLWYEKRQGWVDKNLHTY